RTSYSSLSMNTLRRGRVHAVKTILPECARGSEHVVSNVRGDLDAVQNGEFGQRLEAAAGRIVHDQRQRRLFENVARYGVVAVITVFLAKDHGITLKHASATLDGFDLDAFDVELDEVLAVRGNPAVVEQIVERKHGHAFTA